MLRGERMSAFELANTVVARRASDGRKTSASILESQSFPAAWTAANTGRVMAHCAIAFGPTWRQAQDTGPTCF